MDRLRPETRKVVVLGAGPAGLAAAYVLAAAGVKVTVVEQAPHVGGLCATHEQGGFRFDLGGHRWFTKNAELHRWFLELMKDRLVTVHRSSRICFHGRYFRYPLSLRDVLAHAGIVDSAMAMLSYFRSAISAGMRRKPPATLRDAFCDQFGRRLYEMFFRRYSEKVWGRPCEEISADWAGQRSKGLSILTAVRDSLVKTKGVVSLVDEFVYPREGYQVISERMAEEVARSGGEVRLCTRAVAVESRGPHDLIVRCTTAGGDIALDATDVISTLPLPLLVRLAAPAAPASVREAAESLAFRDLITVTVMVRRPQITEDTWVYIHDEDVLFARIHEPKNWSPALVPSPDVSSLVCECFCSQGDATWNMTDTQIVARVVADLSTRLGYIQPDEVFDSCVIRTRNAYPVYDLTYRSKLTVIYDWVHRHEGLHVVGRGGTFRYNNADHSIEMGKLLAKTLLGGATDHMSVNTENEYLEEIHITQASARRAARRT